MLAEKQEVCAVPNIIFSEQTKKWERTHKDTVTWTQTNKCKRVPTFTWPSCPTCTWWICRLPCKTEKTDIWKFQQLQFPWMRYRLMSHILAKALEDFHAEIIFVFKNARHEQWKKLSHNVKKCTFKRKTNRNQSTGMQKCVLCERCLRCTSTGFCCNNY